MFKIPRSTPFIKDALGPRRLSQIWKIWYVLICLSMESDLRTLWAQWLSPKHPQRLCKVCWSTVLLFKDLVIAMSMNEHLSGKTKFSMASCTIICKWSCNFKHCPEWWLSSEGNIGLQWTVSRGLWKWFYYRLAPSNELFLFMAGYVNCSWKIFH